ncbi:DUF2750 domain-containing protein [Priestia aryabhattai]|uniref:DUF2750 domain-containing protein n=2 Tax=Priestia TaxID=2800373 RepID=UPI001C8E8CC8|nr:DUF2750 domain-containing protein [Priestia aryabhattai]MBX9966785.1 DUF2750 domain-containing protein [Priestia aryabhattai]MBZ6487707.1 DUF2750 domain-containing protein [Priestia aryabhattai]
MELDLTVNSKRRYANFVKRVSESKVVWGLKSEDGWCVCESNEYEETAVMLFWSDEAYVKQCAVEEWSNYKPTSIALEEFMNNWIYGMHNDDLLVGVNWNAKLIGLEVEPYDLLNELEDLLEK